MVFRASPDRTSSSKPCVNVSPYSTATITKNNRTSLKTAPTPVDSIQQLIIQMTSQDIETSKNALISLDKMLLRPDVREILMIEFVQNLID